jgi:hypothetical protein
MAEFVRVCPRCGQANPEYENLCSGCNQFIGMEPAVPAPAAASPAPAPEPAPNPAPAGSPPPAPAVPAAQPTRRYVPVAESFYLQLEGQALRLNVRHGSVLGQAHPGNDADLQVPATVTGADFLHRRHCRFERDGAGWWLVALDQQDFGSAFTNPSAVNQHRLGPGQRQRLNDGDQVRLSGLTFLVQLV